jgi:hypothetical protein
MDPRYYQGHTRHHAAFWVSFRDLPVEECFAAFINFYQKVKREVGEGRCSLREAGYALKPGCYNKSAYPYPPYDIEMSFVDDAVEDIIIIAATDDREAKEIWDYIVGVMDDIVGLSNRPPEFAK